MKNYLLSLLLLISIHVWGQADEWNSKKYFTVVSYNTENLFDTIDAPNKNDQEFTPFSEKKWDSERYFNKIEKIAYVLSSINTNEYPELIGLVEVESDLALEDLIHHEYLEPGKYDYIITKGPDPRGINCALLYRPEVFKYISYKEIPVRFPFANNARTRDILYVLGSVKKDTLHVFVNHWSSRRGGEEKSEIKRTQSASVLKSTVDSLLLNNPNANIIIMGDFNDEPADSSIYQVLNAGPSAENKPLTNLLYDTYAAGKGTYYFRGEYNLLDQMIINSASAQKTKGFRPLENQAHIFMPDTICFTNKNGDKSPSKTYGGNNYYGGFSDHFPIYMFFNEK